MAPSLPLAHASIRAQGLIRAQFATSGGRTHVTSLHEAGGLRLKFPRLTRGCEAVIINTAGGVVAGDRATLSFTVGRGATATVTTQAAEKIYKSDGATAAVDVRLGLDGGATLEWLPQETILFDRARLERRLEVDLAADASLLAVEMIVFGRLGMGETMRAGLLSDQWRVRRAGTLLFADALRFQDDVATTLDRATVGAGARAIATLLHVMSDPEGRLGALREIADAFSPCDVGFSAWQGMLVGRFASPSPERLRACIVAVLSELRGRDAPRVWQ